MKKIIQFALIISIFLLNGCVDDRDIIDDTDIGGVSLKMDASFGEGKLIAAVVEDAETLYTGFPVFEVYQFFPWDSIVNDGDWIQIDIYDTMCALSCSSDEAEICDEPIVCAPIPEHCQDFDFSIDKFEWDQTIIKTKTIECGSGQATCSFKEKAEPGTYKIVFRFAEECADEWLFESEENNIQTIEKEFEITSGQQKEVLYNIIEVMGIECEGCGWEVFIIGKVFTDNTKEELDEPLSLFHTDDGPESECLKIHEETTIDRKQVLESIEFSVYADYLLTEEETETLSGCIKEAEGS